MTDSDGAADEQQSDLARTFLAERIRTGCAWLVLGFTIFLVGDLVQSRAVLARLLPLKLVQLGAIVSTWAALGSARLQHRPIPILLLFAAVYSATVAAQSVVRGDLTTAALTLVSLALVTAVLLPAGGVVHLAMVAVASASMLAGVYALTGGFAAAFTLPGLTLWAAASGSVLIAQQRQLYEVMVETQRRALLASDESLRLVLDATNDGVWDWNVKTGAVHHSPRWIASLGYTSAEVPARVSFWESLVHPDDLPRMREALQAHFDGKTEIYECENRLRTKSGAWRPNRDRGKVVERAADGRPLRMVGTDTDITELQQRQGEIAALLAVSQDITGTLDRIEIMERVQAHAAAALSCERVATFYLDPERGVYRQFSQFGVPPELQPAAEQVEFGPESALVESLIAGQTVVIDSQTLQSLIDVEVLAPFGMTALAATPLRVRGRHLGALVALSTSVPRLSQAQVALLEAMARQLAVALEAADLYESERERAAESAALAQELDRANAVKGDFVASMSHELRNPLNILIGYHELLLEGAFDPLTERQAEVVARLRHQSHDLLTMINATLDLSGLESGRVPLRWEQVDVGALVAAVAHNTHPRVAGSAVRVEVSVDESLPALRTDAGKLKLILANLLGNALKFTAQGCITISARTEGGGIVIAVTDTGMGIAPEAQHKIFEPFQQADATIASRFGGAGLGLHIVRRMVHLLGGTVALESELGRGSAFRVWLPAAAVEEGAEPGLKDGTTGMGI